MRASTISSVRVFDGYNGSGEEGLFADEGSRSEGANDDGLVFDAHLVSHDLVLSWEDRVEGYQVGLAFVRDRL